MTAAATGAGGSMRSRNLEVVHRLVAQEDMKAIAESFQAEQTG